MRHRIISCYNILDSFTNSSRIYLYWWHTTHNTDACAIDSTVQWIVNNSTITIANIINITDNNTYW